MLLSLSTSGHQPGKVENPGIIRWLNKTLDVSLSRFSLEICVAREMGSAVPPR